MWPMPNSFPEPVPGRDLLAERKRQGIRQQDLAARMRKHRTGLYDIETADEVPPILAAKYRAALKELVDEAIAAAGTADVA